MCGIVMIHADGGSLPSLWGKIGTFGGNGVHLFFIISSYLAYVSLEKHEKNYGSLNIYEKKKWWKRRFIRLMPAYYIALVLFLFVLGIEGNYWIGSLEKVSGLNFLSHLLFVHGLNPYYFNSILGVEWYLGCLAIFYWIVPFLYQKVNSVKKSFVFFAVGTIVAIFLKKVLLLFPPIIDDYIWIAYMEEYSFLPQIPVLSLGIFLFFLINKTELFAKLKGKKFFSCSILTMGLGCLAGRILGVPIFLKLPNTLICAFGFGSILISQFIYECSFLNSWFFSCLGRYSYGIYLIHYLILKLYDHYVNLDLTNEIIDWLIRYLIVLAVSFLFSVIVNEAIEKPFNKYMLD